MGIPEYLEKVGGYIYMYNLFQDSFRMGEGTKTFEKATCIIRSIRGHSQVSLGVYEKIIPHIHLSLLYPIIMDLSMPNCDVGCGPWQTLGAI